MKSSVFPFWISLKVVPEGPINNKVALVQVMAWHHIGVKPLPGPVFAQFIDAYIWHSGEMSLRNYSVQTYIVGCPHAQLNLILL